MKSHTDKRNDSEHTKSLGQSHNEQGRPLGNIIASSRTALAWPGKAFIFIISGGGLITFVISKVRGSAKEETEGSLSSPQTARNGVQRNGYNGRSDRTSANISMHTMPEQAISVNGVHHEFTIKGVELQVQSELITTVRRSYPDIFQPSRDRVFRTRARILLALSASDEAWLLDRLANDFEADLRPSDIEVAEQFGNLLRELQESNLLELYFKEGSPAYRLTEFGCQRVAHVRGLAEANAHSNDR